MHFKGDLNYERGYEWWLMKEAKVSLSVRAAAALCLGIVDRGLLFLSCHYLLSSIFPLSAFLRAATRTSSSTAFLGRFRAGSTPTPPPTRPPRTPLPTPTSRPTTRWPGSSAPKMSTTWYGGGYVVGAPTRYSRATAPLPPAVLRSLCHPNPNFYSSSPLHFLR